MSSVNKVILIGNLGKDPEVKTFDNGDKIANVSIATSEKYKDRSGEVQSNTQWHNITFRGKVVDVVEKYLKKGSKVYIEGKLQTRSYEQDGITKYVTEIVCYNMQMLGGNDGQGQSSSQASKPEHQANAETSSSQASSEDEDDLPF